MFCIGNFKLFSRKSELWNSIVTKLKVKNMIGEKLPMQCDKHKTGTEVKTADDILAFLKFGCSEKCDFELPCGHKCNRSCHLDDSNHFMYLCEMPCTKFIDETRICPKLCYQRCKRVKKCVVELPCGHYSRNISRLRCEEEVQRCLPCSHIDTLPCYLDVSEHKCQKLVSVELSCGHVKDVPCFSRNNIANFVCNELQPKISPCGHTAYVPCNLNMVENELLSFCTKSCDVLLNCGHPCVGLCRWCFDIGIHASCIEKCELMLPCGHNCQGYCGSPCPPCERKCYLSCPHGAYCINKCIRPCVECNESCVRHCDHTKCTNKCFEECTVNPCVVACSTILPCNHKCIGLCGDPCICLECNNCEFAAGNNYVLLEDCEHIIEVNRLNEHIEICLFSLDWPNCPLCGVSVSNSRRYKT
ncbi:NFX1-type zinc finger-containing protein 1, partial [Stegodyphus mimosarum]